MAEFKLGLGVAVPISNNQFNISTQFEGKLSVDTSSGLSTITLSYNTDSSDLYFAQRYDFGTEAAPGIGLNQILLSGDLVEIGPSGNTTNKGVKEVLTVQSATSNTITFTTVLSNAYLAGDIVKGIGRALAGGWYPVNELSLQGIHNYPPKPYTTPHQLYDYLGGMTYQKVSASTEDIGTAGVSKEFTLATKLASSQEQAYRPIMPSTTYRVGIYFKVEKNSSGIWEDEENPNDGLVIEVTDGESSFINSLAANFTTTLVSDSTDNWHLATTIGTTGVFSSYESQTMALKLRLQKPENLIVNNIAGASYNSVFLEHAKLSDGSSNGVYWFSSDGSEDGTPIAPDMNRTWTQIQSKKILSDADGFKKIYNMKNPMHKRWQLDLNFTWYPESFLLNLNVFLSWQRKGHKLIFHTGQDNLQDSLSLTGGKYTDDTGMPPFLIGTLLVNGTNRPITDFTKKNLSLTFIEAEHGFSNSRF